MEKYAFLSKELGKCKRPGCLTKMLNSSRILWKKTRKIIAMCNVMCIFRILIIYSSFLTIIVRVWTPVLQITDFHRVSKQFCCCMMLLWFQQKTRTFIGLPRTTCNKSSNSREKIHCVSMPSVTNHCWTVNQVNDVTMLWFG